MRQIEAIDRENWKTFLERPVAVLMLSKSDCENCARWTAELSGFLESDEEFANVGFGKLVLDQPGLIEFKKASPWLKDVDDLPYNVIYVDGERKKSWAGGGTERLVNRLRRVASSDNS